MKERIWIDIKKMELRMVLFVPVNQKEGNKPVTEDF